METVLQFTLLGLGSGAIYAMAALGLVQIARGSGVLNFAQGAFALFAAHLFYELWVNSGWALATSMAVSISAAGGLGVLTYAAVMRPLERASLPARVIATIGVMVVVQQAVTLLFDTEETAGAFVPSFYPRGALELSDEVVLGYDRVVLIALSLLFTFALWFVMRTSRFGLSTQAVAESPRALRTLGRSPQRIAIANWGLGAALGGAAGVLIVPISGLANTAILLVVVPALAASLIGRFQSYALTTLAALSLGAGQSLVTKYATDWELPGGTAEALPFLVIVAVLAISGSALPTRVEARSRLPRVARRPPRYSLALPFAGAAMLLAAISSEGLAASVITTAIAATIALSLVVITGLTGQVSLAQYALAGVGGFAAGRLSQLTNWPFPILLLLGILAGACVGVVFGLPSLRTRGPALAVITAGLGLAIENVVFGNREFIGGMTGTPVHRPSLFGWDISPITHPQRYAVVAVAIFALLTILIANLRSGAVGRRLLAVRSNERASTALGVNVGAMKLFAFAVSAAVAATGGVLIAFRHDTVLYQEYGFLNSLSIITLGLIGGVGYLMGAAVAGFQAPSGVVNFLFQGISDSERYLVLISGVLVIVILIFCPDGVAHLTVTWLRARMAQLAGRSTARTDAASGDRGVRSTSSDGALLRERIVPKRLEVRELVVNYGGIRAVDGVSLVIEPGCITGLIGANGAGKTTLIDAISGFVPMRSGRLTLAGSDIGHRPARTRARLGIGRAFQTVELFDDMTVRENLLVATERITPGGWITSFVARGSSGLPDEIEKLTHALELDGVLEHDPTELPHGQRRLVGVARALARYPSVLLLDEPAAGLDRGETRELGALLRRVAKQWGVGILLVEHDVELVSSVSDEIVAIDFGRPIFAGPPAEALVDNAVRGAYLGAEDSRSQVPAGKGM